MANKFQIIGSSLVITDTISGDILLENPKRDSFYYYRSLREDQVVRMFDTNGTNQTGLGLVNYPLADCVDSTDTAFTEATFLTFVRDNLGFNTTSGGSGVIDGEVEFRADLPVTLVTPALGDIYAVQKNTTVLGFKTYQNGLYIKQTDTGSLSDWERMNVKTNFTDSEFSIVNAADTTRKAKFDASAITASTTRTYQYPDKNGTIALLSDVTGGNETLAETLALGDETGDNNIVLDPGPGPHTSPPSRGAISVTDPGFLTTSTIFFLQDSPNTRIDISNGGTVNQGSINIWGEAQVSISHTIGGFVTVLSTGVTMGGGVVTIPSTTGYQLQNGANEIIFTANPTSNGLTQTFQDASGTIALLSDITPSLTFNVDLDDAESSVVRVVSGGRTTFTITHNLNTLDLKPEVFRLSNGRTMGWRIERTGVNEVEASRSGNVANGLFRILI